VSVAATGTLLVTYEAPYPEPLHAKRPHPSAFGLALALLPQPGPHSLARLQLELVEAAADPMQNPDLEALRRQMSGDDNTVLYGFSVSAGERVLLSGRAIVVLDAAKLGNPG